MKLDYTYGVQVNGVLDPTKNNGNLQSQTITLPGLVLTQSYTYDELNRLKSAQEMNGANQVWKQTFSYDRFGNRRFEATNTTLPQITPQNEASTNPAISPDDNRITAAGYRYDPAGNLECDPTHPCGSTAPYYQFDGDNRIKTANGGATGGGTTYLYDGDNRIKTANGGATGGGTTYLYDGDGRRVKKIIGGPTPSTRVFVYDIGGQMIAEYSDQQPTGGGTSYLTADHLGTPRVITRANGSVSGRHDYQPFGEEIAATYGGRASDAGYPGSDGLRQQFTLKERDVETGLDYFLARYYSSMQGRFTSVDPQNIVFEKGRGRNAQERGRILQSYLVQPQNWNRYAYTRNNPLAYTDPNGRCSAPAGLSKGNVGICIEAFIATARVGSGALQGVGDNRTFAANDPTKTNRIELRGTITPGRDASGWSYHLPGKASVSEAVVGGVVTLSREGTLKLDIKTTSIDKDGNAHLAITMTGINGFSGIPGAPEGAITLNVNLVITPDGKVGIERGERTAYPSVGIYVYTMGSDGQPRVATLGEGNETTIDALTKPTVPIQPVAPTCNCEKKPEDR